MMCNYFGRHDGIKDEPHTYIRGVVSTPWTPWAMPIADEERVKQFQS